LFCGHSIGIISSTHRRVDNEVEVGSEVVHGWLPFFNLRSFLVDDFTAATVDFGLKIKSPPCLSIPASSFDRGYDRGIEGVLALFHLVWLYFVSALFYIIVVMEAE
jgi:hypothetical protein